MARKHSYLEIGQTMRKLADQIEAMAGYPSPEIRHAVSKSIRGRAEQINGFGVIHVRIETTLFEDMEA